MTTVQETKKDIYKFSRLMYIIEAAIEYFISIAVGTVYLARITSYIGFSDSLTGILSAFVSLGCSFQLVAIFLVNKRPAKRFVTVWHIISQVLFGLLYFVPLLNVSLLWRTIIFTAILLTAQIIHNIINSHKINWFMSLVDSGKRGKFTASKEIVSLLGGIAFTYFLGKTMDYYESIGDIRSSFIICGIGILILMGAHTCTLILSKEKPSNQEHIPVKENLKELLKNKILFKIILIPVLWNIANYATVSFSGTYQVKELAFSTTLSSFIIIVGSLARVIASRPLGILADKYSFRKMLLVCFSIEAIGFGINIFTVPENGKVMYFIYYTLHCIGLAGINSATINLIYDYIEYEQRTSALALQQTLAGIAGFLVTLLLTPLVSFIQNKNLPIYAQQITSGISFIVVLIIIVYICTVIKSLKKIFQQSKNK